MKKGFLLFLAFAIVGCDQIKDEFHTSGGYVAPLLDETTFKAVTQKQQLHRYYYIVALASPLALYSVSDEDGARDTILHVSQALSALDTYDKSLNVCINRQAYDATGSAKTKDCQLTDPENTGYARDITETSYGFEANGLATQRAMARLASDIKNNIGLKVEASNPLESVTSALKFAQQLSQLIGPMRNFAAAYRDTIHITTFSVARLCSIKNPNGTHCGRLKTAVGRYYDQGTGPEIIDQAQEPERVLKTLEKRVKNVITSNELSGTGFLDEEAILALNAQIFTACMRAARLVDGWSDDETKKYCSALDIPDLTVVE